jgi:hypothetical protein
MADVYIKTLRREGARLKKPATEASSEEPPAGYGKTLREAAQINSNFYDTAQSALKVGC